MVLPFSRFARQTQRRGHRRAAGDAAQNALLARQAARHLDGLLVGDLLHPIDQRQVQILRDEPRADALDLVRRRRQRLRRPSLGNDRRVRGLHRDGQ